MFGQLLETMATTTASAALQQQQQRRQELSMKILGLYTIFGKIITGTAFYYEDWEYNYEKAKEYVTTLYIACIREVDRYEKEFGLQPDLRLAIRDRYMQTMVVLEADPMLNPCEY